MTCPECGGQGSVGGISQQVAGEPQTATWEGEGCWVCDGDGELTQEQYDEWAMERAAQFDRQLEAEGDW